jgi:hypothetical protein
MIEKSAKIVFRTGTIEIQERYDSEKLEFRICNDQTGKSLELDVPQEAVSEMVEFLNLFKEKLL